MIYFMLKLSRSDTAAREQYFNAKLLEHRGCIIHIVYI